MPYKVVYSDSLSHHGILGQKWGVRRYQNEDGSWTAAGRERYGKGGGLRERHQQNIDRLSAAYQKNNHMSKKQADAAAKSFINRKNALIAAGTALALAGGAYALVRYKNADLDQTFDAGKVFHRVQDQQYDDIQDVFYASTNGMDRNKYIGMFGEKQTLFGGTGEFKQELTLQAKDKLKVCGNKNAEKLWSELAKSDSEFADAYSSFREFITDAPLAKDGAAQKYFDFLSSKGYSGVIDWHDQVKQGKGGSDFQANQPVIFFGNAKSNVDIVGKEVLDADKVGRAQAGAILQTLGDFGLNSLPYVGAGMAALGAYKGALASAASKKATEGNADEKTKKASS